MAFEELQYVVDGPLLHVVDLDPAVLAGDAGEEAPRRTARRA
ncbi:MAG: hypothetical protein ACR2K3_01800 [Nocardioides sp.]